MIDLHAHILPGIDDGPPDLESSVRMVRAAAAGGVTRMAATPHMRGDYPDVRPEDLAGRCAELQAAVADEAIELIPAAEVDLLWALGTSDDDLRLASYGGRGNDLLVETPYGPLPDRFEEMLFDISLKGFRVLLAHPENNPTFQRDPARLEVLVSRGVLVQITARRLTERGRRRSPAARLAEMLFENGNAHVIASDSHSSGPWRPPDLGQGVDAAARLGARRARWMVTESPAAILAGSALTAGPPAEADRRRDWWGRRGRRRSERRRAL